MVLLAVRIRTKEEKYSIEGTGFISISVLFAIIFSLYLVYIGISNFTYSHLFFFIPLLICVLGFIAGLEIDPKMIDAMTLKDFIYNFGKKTFSTYSSADNKITISNLAKVTMWLARFDLKYVFVSLILGIIFTAFILLTYTSSA